MLRTASVIIWGFPLPLVFIILVNTTSGPLFYLIIAMHKPLSWHLGLPQDGQIVLITPPSQTYEAAKAPARPRSYLSPKARARIMADPQRPKGTDSQTQDAKYPPAIRAVGCGLPLLINSSTPAACRCWNKLAQISHWSLEPEQREGRRCGGGWRGRIFFFLFANIQFHHWQGWQMETN